MRAEEYTPSYAGKATRMDFLLKAEKIVIELKMMRDSLKDGDIGGQLIEDCARYGSHPDCEKLVCYVYDPEHLLNNPDGLQADLSKRYDSEIDVIVIVSSST